MEDNEDVGTVKPTMTANQLATKVVKLRLKGKHEETEKVLMEAETIKESQNTSNRLSRQQIDETTSRIIMHDVSARQQKRKEDDGDLHLAQNIMHNHWYSVSAQADEEYDYEGGPPQENESKKKPGWRRQPQVSKTAGAASCVLKIRLDQSIWCYPNSTRLSPDIVAF